MTLKQMVTGSKRFCKQSSCRKIKYSNACVLHDEHKSKETANACDVV